MHIDQKMRMQKTKKISLYGIVPNHHGIKTVRGQG